MKKLLSFIFILLILTNFISAEIDEKALEKNVKPSLFKKILKDFRITAEVEEEINKTNLEVMEDLNEVCEKTSG